MNNDFLEIINKGVPISTPITIIVTDLEAIATNKKELKEAISKEFDSFMKYLKEISAAEDIEFFMTLCVLSDSETLEKNFILHLADLLVP